MAAGGAAGSASRELPAPRRPVRAPLLFNEKEYFYRARVLRRARKAVVSAGRPDRPAGTGELAGDRRFVCPLRLLGVVRGVSASACCAPS